LKKCILKKCILKKYEVRGKMLDVEGIKNLTVFLTEEESEAIPAVHYIFLV
jgi:hypothetical protein